jgi:hypothetical protein
MVHIYMYNVSLSLGSPRVSLNNLTNRTYDNIDFTLLYKLMRSFSILDDPKQGWGKQPTNTDVTISDDVERLRFAHVVF